MHKKIVGLTLLAYAASASVTQAQGPITQIGVGVFGQYTVLDDKLFMDNVPAIGGRIGVSVYKWLGVEADIQYGATKATRAPNEDIKYSPFHGLATLTIPFSQRVGLVLGGGYVNSIYKGRATANEYEDGVSALIGLKVCSSGKWGARLDGIGDFNPSPNEQELTGTSRNLGVRLGVNYALRGNCAHENEKFDWSMAIAPATATIAAGSSRQYALSSVDMKQRPIETRKINNLVCSSSDASVATVDNTGNVTAVKPGNATITCNGTVKNIARSVSAQAVVPYPEWTFTMAPTSASRDVGQTAAFTTTARDAAGADLGAATTWTSSNNAVATVNNGTVTCVSGGTATITATKNANGGSKTASATVTCIAPPPPPTGMIRLDSTHFNFDRATILPAGRELLQTVVDAMKRDPNLRVSIEGHTDWYGDESYNQKLSVSRATAVTTALKRLAGSDIAADRFSMAGYGEQCIIVRDGDADPNPPRPRVSAANKAAQAPNRRVEIWQVISGETGSPTSCRSESQRAGRVPFDTMR